MLILSGTTLESLHPPSVNGRRSDRVF